MERNQIKFLYYSFKKGFQKKFYAKLQKYVFFFISKFLFIEERENQSLQSIFVISSPNRNVKKLNPDYNLAEKSCHFLTLEFKNCEEIPSISPYFKKKYLMEVIKICLLN